MSLATQDFWIPGNKLELTEFSSDHECALGIKVEREDSVGIVLEECIEHCGTSVNKLCGLYVLHRQRNS